MPQSARHPSIRGANEQIPASTKNGGPTQQPCSIRLNMLFRRVRIFFLPHDASSPQYPPLPGQPGDWFCAVLELSISIGPCKRFFFSRSRIKRRQVAATPCLLAGSDIFSVFLLSTPSIYLPIHLPICLPARLSIYLARWLPGFDGFCLHETPPHGPGRVREKVVRKRKREKKEEKNKSRLMSGKPI